MDDEKLTDDWILRCGFSRWATDDSVFSMRFYAARATVELWRQESGRYEVWLFGVRLPNKLDTRGQLKRLALAIGLELIM